VAEAFGVCDVTKVKATTLVPLAMCYPGFHDSSLSLMKVRLDCAGEFLPRGLLF